MLGKIGFELLNNVLFLCACFELGEFAGGPQHRHSELVQLRGMGHKRLIDRREKLYIYIKYIET